MIKRFLRNTAVTDSIITDSAKRTGLKGSIHYFLSIEYKDISGKIFTGNAIGSKKSIKGSTVAFMY